MIIANLLKVAQIKLYNGTNYKFIVVVTLPRVVNYDCKAFVRLAELAE